ncbi:MAG TPA: CRISPR-associated protein Csx16 [Rheinheimera sp.]|uniref:CRISPR-associated protein Csx16 n=1 Tax=Rheinheimera sp. TaxID=1869214 RepID=UPI002F93F385
MAFWLVSRHSGEQNWIELERMPCDSTLLAWLAPEVTAGDIVLGALPMPMVAQLNLMGVHVVHLTLTEANGPGKNLAKLAATGLTAVCYKAEQNFSSAPSSTLQLNG